MPLDNYSFSNTKSKCFKAKLLLFLVIESLNVSAMADQYDTFQFRFDQGKTYDSNLFKRASGEVSEQITRTTVGMKLDKTYSLQRVFLDLNVIDNKYKVTDYLDFVAKNYNAAWYWALTPELTGILSSEKTQSLNSFGDVRITTQLNIRTMTMNQFRAYYSPHNVWSLSAGFSQTSLENSEVFTAISDFDDSGFDYGLKYQFASGSNLQFMGHNRRGEFSKRPLDSFFAFDSGYSENEYEVKLLMQDQGKSKLSGRVGYINRQYDNFDIRNYASYIGDIRYELQVTGKIKGIISLSRLVAPFEAANSTYTLSDDVRARLLYDISPKVQAGINLSYSERDFEGSGRFGTSGRLDKEGSYGVSVRWSPTNYIGLSLNSTKSNRNSSVSTFDFDDTLTSINLDLKL